MSKQIRVLIAEDNAVLRHALTDLFEREPDIDVVGRAGDGVEAVRLANVWRPDVALLDIKMPRLDGIEAARAISQAQPQIRVVMLTTFKPTIWCFAPSSPAPSAICSRARRLELVFLASEAALVVDAVSGCRSACSSLTVTSCSGRATQSPPAGSTVARTGPSCGARWSGPRFCRRLSLRSSPGNARQRFRRRCRCSGRG